ncbi:Rv2253 family sensor-like surface protein [Mycolicibacterium palauense]|uniref:hypothetical protein n=1 Tax=Mycolicibacterium palauense TaxID=2034511 RepID=UPI000BFEC3C5|nr:hypothetical protein [Mycolicibacterium palauense]
MTAKHRRGGILASAALMAGSLVAAPAALADEAPDWNGRYKVTFHTDEKSGTSMAAGQQETPYTVSYLFTTDCSSGECVASATDGPTPKQNVSTTVTFDWTGSHWSRTADWRWDCLLSDGTITFDPATSVTTYVPQPDGSLTGTFATTVDSGACQGSVSIPLTAVPA